MKGLFITIEGVEGSGKTTVTHGLANWLRQQGLNVIVTAEPGGTPFGERVREILLSSEERIPLSEAFLFFASRADHTERVIRLALERGAIVLCDRYSDSTFAYQSFGLGLPLDLLQELNSISTGGLVPDLTLLLDIDPEIGLLRVQQATTFELRSLSFHHRVRWGYLWLAKREPQRIKVVDAFQPLEDVLTQAKAILQGALAKWRWRISSETNTPF